MRHACLRGQATRRCPQCAAPPIRRRGVVDRQSHWSRLEGFDVDIPELDRIVVTGESEMAFGESLAGMTFE